MNKIAICVDKSSSSLAAIETAVKFANRTGDKIVIIHSLKPVINNRDMISESKQNMIERGENMISDYINKAKELSSSNINVTGELINDDKDSIKSIVDYISNNEDINHVFIGHKSLDKKHEKIYGSFAKKLIGESTVPVTVSNSEMEI
mgnify:CR=1 FL=1